MSGRRARRTSRPFLTASVVVAALWAAELGTPIAQSARPQVASSCEITADERVVAVGDVHGAFDQFVAILREAKLIDSRRRWIGGRTIFVQTGDIMDRGPDSRKVLDLLQKLTTDAAKAGGRVHALLGNHEAMRAMGYYRDVGPGEYAAFRSPDAENLRSRYYELVRADNAERSRANGTEFDERAFRTQFFDGTPLGFVEMQRAFAPRTDYGRWLRERDTMVKINGVVFMHGGASAVVAALGCPGINAQVRAELGTVSMTDPNLDTTFVAGPEGPLWYRGLADGSPGVGEAEVDGILTALGARAIVVGHTVAAGFRIRSSFGGRVVQIDTGMLGGEFYPGVVASALEIQDGIWTAIYEGRRETLRPAISTAPQG